MAWTAFNGVDVRAENLSEELATWKLTIFLNDDDRSVIIFSSPDNVDLIDKTGEDLFGAHHRIGQCILFRDLGKSTTLAGAYDLVLRNRERKAEYELAQHYR